MLLVTLSAQGSSTRSIDSDQKEALMSASKQSSSRTVRLSSINSKPAPADQPTLSPTNGEISSSGRLRRGEGREAICRALVALVAREGLDKVTFRSVAREAGVTAGLASYHFRDRDTMVGEALQWAAQHSTSVAMLSSDTENIADFASTLPALMRDFPEEAMFSFELILAAARRPELSGAVRQSYNDLIGAVANSLSHFGLTQNPQLANLVFAAIDGLSLQYLIYGDVEATRAGVTALQKLLQTAVTAKNV